ncbi:peptidoglycan DD-metalloendopeptidase family protein, partial [Flavobacterium covae]|uniref:peptidoglycan DD-metalloendopeptidase family protein n=1 Tax=Flavobacterium covae TaxID=2906076 RepID=UPI0033987CFD
KIPKICKVDLNYVDDSKGSVFSFTEKLRAKAHCINMFNKEVLFTLWEDDAKGSGHNTTNQLIDTKKAKVDLYGDAEVDFMLTKALMKKAMEGETDIRELEFYVTVEYYKTKKHTTSNVEVKNPSPTENKKPSQPTAIKKAKGSPAEHKPRSKKEEKGVFGSISETIDEIWDWAETQGIAQRDKPHTIEIPEGKSPAVIGKTKVEKASVETIIDVYFAKEEFTKETTEKTGTHQYKFQNENKNIDKDKIATIIKKKVDEAIRKDKKYSKLDDIKAALTKTTYAKNEVISFDVYKLGSNLVKINNAPLEEEIYIVAKTVLLEGKEVNIKIKEKEEILIAKAADLPVQEAKKDGAELTTLKATVEKGEAKIKIKLRPKSDEDLKKWKEKLAGIKDGQHTYTFGGKNDTSTDAKKKTVAGIIIKKIKDELAKNKKFAKSEDIVKALTNASYDKGEKITFDTYKVPTEYLWLQAECQGDVKKHEGEFLKKDGEYFEIGKKCECEARIRAFMRMLRVGEGTEGEKGYTTQYSGSQFSDMNDHPHEVIKSGNYSSSAAGAYQIMADTYDGLATYRTKYNIPNFNQESQDKLCLVILKHSYQEERPDSFYNPTYWKNKEKKIRDYEKENIAKERRKRFKGQNGDIIKMILDNNYEKAVLLSALCWASLPDSPYGQPTETKEDCKANYEKFLKEELEEKSDLHIKKGFLKEFGYSCGCNNDTCPDDFSQCFNYADVWDNPEISSDNGGKNNNRYGYNSTRGHKGIDILSGPIYKDVHSLMCGTVGKIVDSFKTNEYKENSLGNTLMIKSKDKDGNEIFILYCHLDEIYVQEGDKVKHGQRVAKSGSTGNASYSGLPNGVKGHGIEKEYWHCHIEAATKGEGSNNFFYLGSYRVKAEDYMKTKFDENGNKI